MNPKTNVLTKVVDLDWTVEKTTSSWWDPYIPEPPFGEIPPSPTCCGGTSCEDLFDPPG